MDLKQCYAILEIDSQAALTEVKQAYRDLIKVWHPDRFTDSQRLMEKAERKLKTVNEAYQQIITMLEAEVPAINHEIIHDSGNSRIIAVASGKGGVGKTNFSLNIAVAFKEFNENVIILDADLGMANIDVLCGLTPKYNLANLIRRQKKLEDIILNIFDGVKLIPGVSGIEALQAIDQDNQLEFLQEIQQLEDSDQPSIVLIDVGAGMGPGVLGFMLAAHENIIITTPEPTALMDAYALIKTILIKKPDADLSIVVNMVQTKEEGDRIFSSVNRISNSFLGREVKYLGHIFFDKSVQKSVQQQTPYYLAYPSSKATACIRAIAAEISNKPHLQEYTGGIQSFFKKMSMFLFDRKNP